MDTFINLLKRIFLLFQASLILLYLILEELVWNNIAKPIQNYIKQLNIAQKVEHFLNRQNRYIVLTIFLLMFVIGEGLGLVTPVFLAKGLAFMAVVMYGFKIVLATFAFWIFNTQKKALLSFAFIDYSYKKIVYYIDKIKASELYKNIVKKLKVIKSLLKEKFIYIKNYLKERFF